MENNIFTNELKEEIFKEPEVYHCILTKEELKQIYFEIERLNNIIEEVIKKAQRIIDYGFDYDGFNNEKDLKGLIDMLVDYAEQIIDILKEKE